MASTPNQSKHVDQLPIFLRQTVLPRTRCHTSGRHLWFWYQRNRHLGTQQSIVQKIGRQICGSAQCDVINHQWPGSNKPTIGRHESPTAAATGKSGDCTTTNDDADTGSTAISCTHATNATPTEWNATILPKKGKQWQEERRQPRQLEPSKPQRPKTITATAERRTILHCPCDWPTHQ